MSLEPTLEERTFELLRRFDWYLGTEDNNTWRAEGGDDYPEQLRALVAEWDARHRIPCG